MLAAWQNNETAWAVASNGVEGAFPGASGMVGELNSAGGWFMYVPPPGVEYLAQYAGQRVKVRNNGNGTYYLSMDGAVPSLHWYASKWFSSSYFDANTNPLTNHDSNVYNGEPSTIYYQAGAEVVSAAGVNPNPPAPPPSPIYVAPVSPPVAIAPAPPPVANPPAPQIINPVPVQNIPRPIIPPINTTPPANVAQVTEAPFPTTEQVTEAIPWARIGLGLLALFAVSSK